MDEPGNGMVTHRYSEVRREGHRLGRHLALDVRSLAYTIEGELAGRRAPIKPAEHLAAIPTLDQGPLGSCTGNAGAYALSALAGTAGLAKVRLNGHGLSATDSAANEAFAVELYAQATQDDGLPGTFPPDDGGSSGLGVCRALRAAGLVDRYTWATSLIGLATMLQRGGVIVGLPWYQSFYEPDTDGFVDGDPSWLDSGVAGGHEVYVEALETWDNLLPIHSVIRFRNSWGDWGANGCGRMRLRTYAALRSQIDVKQIEPRVA